MFNGLENEFSISSKASAVNIVGAQLAVAPSLTSHHSHGSFLQVGELHELGNDFNVQNSMDAQSQAALVFITSLAFLVPSLRSVQTAWTWHGCLFAILAFLSAAQHVCEMSALPSEMNYGSVAMESFNCPAGVATSVAQMYQTWVCFCFLQMAWLVLGPEDPQLHWLTPSSVREPRSAPIDVILVARIIPVCMLSVFHMNMTSGVTVQWQSMLLTEVLLVIGCLGFWWTRRHHAANVLLRFKFWQRLMHHGGLPVIMRIWIFCIVAFRECQVLHCMFQLVIASFAVGLLRAVLPEGPCPQGHGSQSMVGCSRGDRPPSQPVNHWPTPIVDSSASNPSIAHVLLCAPALAVIPATLALSSFDWCETGEFHINTMGFATSCEPGGYFVAMVSVHMFAAGLAAFHLIDTAGAASAPWTQLARPVGSNDPRLAHRERILGKRTGCMLGCASSALGLAASLCARESAVQHFLSMLLGASALICLCGAMILTVLSSDPTAVGFQFRRTFTLFVCMPSLIVHMLLLLLGHCLELPRPLFVLSEQVTVMLFALWPVTWAAELREESLRKRSSAFAWPVTTWRFGSKMDASAGVFAVDNSKEAFTSASKEACAGIAKEPCTGSTM